MRTLIREGSLTKLAAFPLLALAFACGDSTLVQPDESMVPEIAATRAAPMMVPLKGLGTYEWVTFGEPGCDPSRPAEETIYWAATGEFHLTHLGATSLWYVECYEAGYAALLYQRVTLTGANGDELVLLYTGGTAPPAGYDWATNFDVDGGTGRWEGATGYGILAGTINGLSGDALMDGMVSAVGTIQ